MEKNYFDYDWTMINADEIRKIGSSQSEIVSVCETTKRWRENPGYSKKHAYTIAIGYSNKKRIIQVACRFLTYKLQVLAVKLPSEEEIEQYYCDF